MKQTAEHVRRRITARVATLAAKPRAVSAEWLTREYVEEAVRAVWARADAKCERCNLDHRTIRAERGCGDCHRFIHSRRNVGRELLGEN
jgi:uncharacterized paraquat-inducible protein A